MYMKKYVKHIHLYIYAMYIKWVAGYPTKPQNRTSDHTQRKQYAVG